MKKNIQLLSMLLGIILFASCTSDDDPTKDVGYLRIDAETVTLINPRTRAVPENYNPKQLAVQITEKSTGTVRYETDDYDTWEGKSFRLEPGTYTVTASSNGFDGLSSGFECPYYFGSKDVTVVSGKETTAAITCTLANVKVSVNFSDSFKAAFTSANVTVSSGMSGVATQLFTMNQTTGSAYFPVASLQSVVSVVNKAGITHTSNPYEVAQVHAREHHIFNYTVAESGTSGGVTVTVDGTETIYTFEFPVSTEPSTSLSLRSANPWSRLAYVEGYISAIEAGKTIDPANMKFEYSSDNGNTWNSIAATATSDTEFKATLTGLSPMTSYKYRMSYTNGSDNFVSPEANFTTDSEEKIPNLSFDAWCTNSDGDYFANASMSDNDKFWDSGNKGAHILKAYNPTKPEENDVISGKAAYLGSQAIMGQFAAGSLFTGNFGKASMNPLGAELEFGRQFTERPTQLTGYFKYKAGAVTHTKLDYVPAGTPDSCSIYIALTDWDAPFAVNTGNNQFVNFNENYIIAYGELGKSLVSPATAMESYQPFTIDILYRDLTRKPKYILIVCSSSKYGDYFTGSTSSVLLLDEFDLIYGEPKVDTRYIQN